MPNVYIEGDVLFLQGVIANGLPGAFSNPKSKAAVLSVEIVDFAYFNDTIANQSSKTQITPPGTNYYPPGGDYALAKSGMFRFQFVVEGLDQQASDELYTALTQTGTCSPGNRGVYAVLDYIYGTGATCTMDSTSATLVLAEPLSLPPKNNARGGQRGWGAVSGVAWAIVGAVAIFAISG